MIKEDKEYLQSLVTEELPDWKSIYEDGYSAGKIIINNKNKFLRESGFDSEVDLRLDRASKNKITWRAIMGLSSVKEQIEGLHYLHDFGQRTGCVIDTSMVIPNILTGVPKDLRKNLPKGTSFVLEEEHEWTDIAEAVPIQPAFCDFHVGSANAAYNTVNAIKVGSSYTGVFSQFSWDYPGCTDEIKQLSSTLQGIAMVASRHDEKFVIDTYLDDGLPGYFLDTCSYLGYARLEKYIISDLCGARYASSFGQLMDVQIPKMALWLACSDVLKEDDQPGVSYLFSNCIDHWDHDLEANYGVLCSEILMSIIVEKKYNTGVAILPIPITEKVAVPTPEAIANIHAAAHRVEEKADEWMEIVDYKKIEEQRDIIVEKGLMFYENVLKGFEESGIDTSNPLELLLTLKRINPSKMEKMFHPSISEGEKNIVPYLPTSMAKRSLNIKDEVIKNVSADVMEKICYKKILVASGDAHWYGMFVITEVLSELGVEVVDGGVSLDPVDVLDLADEEGLTDICISVHNGQALDYAKQLKQLSKTRDKKYRFFMGGKLNGIIGSETEPRDVTKLVEKEGVITSETVDELLVKLVD